MVTHFDNSNKLKLTNNKYLFTYDNNEYYGFIDDNSTIQTDFNILLL